MMVKAIRTNHLLHEVFLSKILQQINNNKMKGKQIFAILLGLQQVMMKLITPLRTKEISRMTLIRTRMIENTIKKVSFSPKMQ